MNTFARSPQPATTGEPAPGRRAGRSVETLLLVLLLALAAGLGYNAWRDQREADEAVRPTTFSDLAFSDVTVEVTEIPEPGGRAISTTAVLSAPGGPAPGGPAPGGRAWPAGRFGGPAPVPAHLSRLQSVLRQDILAGLRDGGIPSAPSLDETGYRVEHSDRLRVRIVVSPLQPSKGSTDLVYYVVHLEMERPAYLSPRTRTPYQAIFYQRPVPTETLAGSVSSKDVEATLRRVIRGLVDDLAGNYQRSRPGAQKENAR
jgi:hypothetical protein